MYVQEVCRLTMIATRELKRFKMLSDQRFTSQEVIEEITDCIRGWLSAAAGISKFLWQYQPESPKKPRNAKQEAAYKMAVFRTEKLRAICGLKDGAVLQNRDVRNGFEHLDERLDEILTGPEPAALFAGGIVDRELVTSNIKTIYLGTWDPKTMEILWQDHSVSIQVLQDEISQVNDKTADWLVAYGLPERPRQGPPTFTIS